MILLIGLIVNQANLFSIQGKHLIGRTNHLTYKIPAQLVYWPWASPINHKLSKYKSRPDEPYDKFTF